MATVNIGINDDQINAVYALLSNIQNGAETAMSRAINSAVDNAVTNTARGISTTTTLKQALIKSNINKSRSSRYRIGGSMVMRSGQMPLAAFSTSPSAANFLGAGARNGVSVLVFKNKPAVRFRHAFFAIMPNGYIGLFNRDISLTASSTGTDSKGRPRRYRLPIDELFGPFLASIYKNTPGLSADVEQSAAAKLLAELARQTDLLLSNANG